MPAGDASRTWFSEMVEVLRQEWRAEMPWEEIIALRNRLDLMLQQIRLSRGIRPATMWCPVCDNRTQQAARSVSVRAVILALGRFRVLAEGEVKLLERGWAKHRKQESLDLNGKPSEVIDTAPKHWGPSGHSHGASSRSG
jgi:hypothetical protein